MHCVAEYLVRDLAAPCVPVPSVANCTGRVAGPNVLVLPGADIGPAEAEKLRRGVNRPWIRRIGNRVEAVAAAQPIPFLVEDAAVRPARARTAPAAVVLQPPVDVVMCRVVHSDVIEL